MFGDWGRVVLGGEGRGDEATVMARFGDVEGVGGGVVVRFVGGREGGQTQGGGCLLRLVVVACDVVGAFWVGLGGANTDRTGATQGSWCTV